MMKNTRNQLFTYFVFLFFVIILNLLIFSIIFLRAIPSFGIKINENNKTNNYLNISNEIYYRQTLNNCAPYAVMGVINILTGEIKDPEILAKETKWRMIKNLTFPQGLIDLLHKYKIKTKEYNLSLYSNNKKITWLKNQIDNGNPVILLVKVKNIQHYFTVIGYDENGFMLYDSLQEKQNEYSIKTIIDKEEYPGNRYYINYDLIKLWNNGGYKIFFRNWAVVCGEKIKNALQQENEKQEYFKTDVAESSLVFELTEDIKSQLLNYFPDGNYQILNELLDVKYRKIKFAVHCIKKLNFDYYNEDVLICDTIVGFETIEGSFKRYLLIKDFCFVNIDDSILHDFSKGYAGIYGFYISYSYPKAAGYKPGLVIDTYFDNGNRVADSFTISWNEENKRFEKVEFR